MGSSSPQQCVEELGYFSCCLQLPGAFGGTRSPKYKATKELPALWHARVAVGTVFLNRFRVGFGFFFPPLCG